MKQELIKLTCPQCGKEFYRTPSYLRQYRTYKPCCSPKCRNANIKAVRAEGHIQCGERMRAENGELRLPHSRVNIRMKQGPRALNGHDGAEPGRRADLPGGKIQPANKHEAARLCDPVRRQTHQYPRR